MEAKLYPGSERTGLRFADSQKKEQGQRFVRTAPIYLIDVWCYSTD